MDDGQGPVPITDDDERRAIQAQARSIRGRALLFAVAVAAVATVL